MEFLKVRIINEIVKVNEKIQIYLTHGIRGANENHLSSYCESYIKKYILYIAGYDIGSETSSLGGSWIDRVSHCAN